MDQNEGLYEKLHFSVSEIVIHDTTIKKNLHNFYDTNILMNISKSSVVRN